MIKIEDVEVWGWTHSLRGMRNPMDSWDKSDSNIERVGPRIGAPKLHQTTSEEPHFGKADAKLIHSLVQGGTEHRKFLRQVFVAMDITAPLYWWKEYDTYKVGTTGNSTSTMHKIQAKEFTLDMFSCEHLNPDSIKTLESTIVQLNKYRKFFLESKDKNDWWQMIQLLPSSYNQKRTETLTYENALAIIHQRSGHKLDEWNEYVKVVTNLPGMDVVLGGEPKEW